MCQVIYKGNKEINTIDHLKEEYPEVKLVLAYGHDEAIGCCCLCQIDIEETFYRNNIKYKVVGCDEYEIIED